jgi:hypothetical protein
MTIDMALLLSLKYRMNTILKFIYYRAITSVLRRPCPIRIPRSGNAGKQVNCYTVELRKEEAPFLLIEGVTDLGVQGLQWSDEDHQYKIKAEVSFSEIKKFDIAISHFYGLFEVRFDGVFDYLKECIFPKAYFKIWWNGVQQNVYNRRKLFRAKRIKILGSRLI